MGSLVFDSMSIKDKVKFYPRKNELVVFELGSLKEDVLLRKLKYLEQPQSTDNNDKKSTRPGLSQQFLIFIFSSWDAYSIEIESGVARYSIGSGVKADFLVPKIRDSITFLYCYS